MANDVGRKMQRTLRGLAAGLLCLGLLAAGRAGAAENGKFRLGIVTFLSGGAAGLFGVPAGNAAKITIDALNKGTFPAPYAKLKGINGLEIEPVVIDENGGPGKQVEEYRNLVQRHKVDAVIGYISSGDCLAIAPVAEELKTPTVFFDCGTSRLFEDDKAPRYVFRTGLDAAVDNIAAARYVVEVKKDLKTIGGIQQNYAWGQDSWGDFVTTVKQLKPDVKVVAEQFPKLMQGQYSAEISALFAANPDVLHSSFWGGDMESFVLQGQARGLFAHRITLLTCGESAVEHFKGRAPDGIVVGGRGPFGAFAPKNPLSDWLRAEYAAQFKEAPNYPAFKMVQAILGLKAAAEKGAKPSKVPAADEVVGGFTGLTYESPGGTVAMSLAKGHQASQGIAYAEYRYDGKSGKYSLANVRSYPAACVTPPEGMTAKAWVQAGFPGAKCN